MTLYETYAALIRRGMPKHERLQWPGMDEPHWWSTSHGLLCGAVNEADARDLITMHALRWFRTLDTTIILIDGLERNVKFAMKRIDPRLDVDCGYNPDLLDCILEATEHLEPEKQA